MTTRAATAQSNVRPTKVFRPLPWQIAPWRDKSQIMLLTGSAGGGKSHIAMEKVNGFCLKYAGSFCLLVRKVRASISSGSALFFESDVALARAESVLYGARHNQSKSRFEYPNGSIVLYVGVKSTSELMKLKSVGRQGGVDLIFAEEATELEEQDYNILLTRLRGRAAPWRQFILACNPDAPTHWIYRRLIAGGEASIHYSSATDNTHNPEDYVKTLARLTGVDKLRMSKGQWVQASGLIYEDDWNAAENVTEAADYMPDGGDVYWAVDDGYAGELDAQGNFTAASHPRVFLLCQLRGDGRLCVFDESYAVRTRDEVQIREVIDRGYPMPEFAAVDKSAASLKGLLQTEYGLYTQNSAPRVLDSIKEVRRWLGADENGWRRVWVHPRCRYLQQEMVSYIYKKGTDEPLKAFDHGPDALRGLIWRLRYY